MLSENDKLSYHLKYAVIHGNTVTLKDVAKSTRNWYKAMGKHSNTKDDSNKLIGDNEFGRE